MKPTFFNAIAELEYERELRGQRYVAALESIAESLKRIADSLNPAEREPWQKDGDA